MDPKICGLDPKGGQHASGRGNNPAGIRHDAGKDVEPETDKSGKYDCFKDGPLQVRAMVDSPLVRGGPR